MPTDLVPTRLALHAVAERVIAPLRVQVTGNEIALQSRPGGFGTPDLPGGGWVGVSGAEVVRADGDTAPLTSLRAAAAFVGLDHPEALPDEPLAVDPTAVATLARVWSEAAVWLGELAAAATAPERPSEAHLWPEHFDIAIELGDEAAGRRATYGVSPGDEAHPLPYAYVSLWTAQPADPIWNAASFSGADVPYVQAPELWRAARARLAATAAR